MSPYETIPGVEVFFYFAAVLLTTLSLTALLAGWTFFSYRKMFDYYVSIKSASGRWNSFLVPPKDLTGDIFWFITLAGLNGLLIAAGLFVTGWVVYVGSP